MCGSNTCPNNKSGIGTDSLCNCIPNGSTHYREGGKSFAGTYLKYDNKENQWYDWESTGKEWLPVEYPEWTNDCVDFKDKK